jgi:hypothetical protein
LPSAVDALFAHGKSDPWSSRLIMTHTYYKWMPQIPIHKKIIRSQST